MPVTLLCGTATNVSLGTDLTYAPSAQHGPIAQLNHAVTLRINNHPVFFRTRLMPSISEGDVVAVGGTDKAGTFHALALRNMTTGAVYCQATTGLIIIAIISIVAGIPMILLLGLGLFFCGVGAWILWKAINIRKAGELVMQASAPAAQPAQG